VPVHTALRPFVAHRRDVVSEACVKIPGQDHRRVKLRIGSRFGLTRFRTVEITIVEIKLWRRIYKANSISADYASKAQVCFPLERGVSRAIQQALLAPCDVQS
jgi:hypothetical protein